MMSVRPVMFFWGVRGKGRTGSRFLEDDEERAFEYDLNVVYFPSKALFSVVSVGFEEDEGVDGDKLLR